MLWTISSEIIFTQLQLWLDGIFYLWMSDIFACTVKLSNVTIGNGTVGSGCWVVPTGLLLMVSKSAAIGRVKKSGFVEYALHNRTMMKSVPIVSVLLVIIVCCRNLEGKIWNNFRLCGTDHLELSYSWCFFSDVGTCRCKLKCSDWAFLLKCIQMHVGAICVIHNWFISDLFVYLETF